MSSQHHFVPRLPLIALLAAVLVPAALAPVLIGRLIAKDGLSLAMQLAVELLLAGAGLAIFHR